MNKWRKISPQWWMCLKYDVWKSNGVWHASFYLGHRFSRDFNSAADAIRFCDNQ